MIRNINRIFKIEFVYQPNWYYPLIYSILSLIVVVSILLTIAMYLHKYQIKTDVERIGFCKKTILVYLVYMLITFSFFSLLKLMELICYPLYYKYLSSYALIFFITLAVVIIGFHLFITGAHAITFFISSEKSKIKALISSCLYLHVIVLFASFLTYLFTDPILIGKAISSDIWWFTQDSLITLILSILAIVIICIPFIILNRKKVIIIEGKNTSYPLKTFSQYFLLILAAMKIACFIYGAIYMENLPYDSTSNVPVILIYSYVIINALINLSYLAFYIELLHNFRLLNTPAMIEEMNVSKNNSEQKMSEIEG